ncbi:MAG: preprotein translocase subunit SecG [Limisphaerales bacterium]
MSYLIGILTFILFLDCLLLTLLILVQLPKKEAGMGQAFGGGATDALFGAGAGNALTKLTKWAAGTFLGLALLLSMLSVATSEKVSTARDALTDTSGSSTPAITSPGATNPPAAATNVLPVDINNAISAIPTGNTSTNAVTNMLTTTTIVTNALNTNALNISNISNAVNAVKTNAAPLLNATATNTGSLLHKIEATAKAGLNTVSNTAVKAVEDVKKEIPKTDDKK